MGFNTLLVIKNKHLPAIAQDANFGAAIRSVITYGDQLRYENGRTSSVSLSDLPEGCAPDVSYDIQSSESLHADMTGIHVIEKGSGELSALGYAHQPSLNAIKDATEAFSKFGYRVENKAAKFLCEADAVIVEDHMAAERAWMQDYDQDVFAEGSTAFLVLNDGLSSIRDDTALGAHFAHSLQQWWAGAKHISELHASGDMPEGTQVYLPDSIGAGNHANPIQIVSVTPKDQAELIAFGGNWGRELRPHLPLSIVNRMQAGQESHLLDIRKADITQVKHSFLEMGFHVRSPGRTRAESPAHWSKKHWVDLATDLETPEP